MLGKKQTHKIPVTILQDHVWSSAVTFIVMSDWSQVGDTPFKSIHINLSLYLDSLFFNCVDVYKVFLSYASHHHKAQLVLLLDMLQVHELTRCIL